MGTSTPPDPPEFRAEAVRLARSGQQPIAQSARDLGVSDEALRRWIKQADRDEGRRSDGRTRTEREERRRLRRENRVRKEEREIRTKAAAFFAQERTIRKAAVGSSRQSRPVIRSRTCVGGGVSRAGFDAWRKRAPSPRAAADACLPQTIPPIPIKSRRNCARTMRSTVAANASRG